MQYWDEYDALGNKAFNIDDPACFSDLFCLSGQIWCSARFTIEFEIDGRNNHRMFKTVKCMKIF